ncbi:tRNA 4-thiouridine(8) synthase ThiI, partial [Candidatus Gribaldobacteria bacterium]|nr:tRNA 4-thiouridine(8) synthase ThiI [Candidatus Gribaldobacteria bacterium]
LYRRAMVKIAEKIAEKEKAKALITGENLGQVASQTIENISVVEKATNLPIIRPLITDDKQEIIEKAKKIGTYEISILPQQDCCSRFLPKNPETKAQLKDILAEEKKCRLALLIKKSVHL